MRHNRQRRWGWLRGCAAVFAITAVAMGATSSTAFALPANFWGVVPQASPSLEQLQRLKAGGVDSIRIPIVWSDVQPTRFASPDWSGTDPLVRMAAEAGIDVLPFVYGAPSWAVPADRSISSGPPRFLPVRTRVQRLGWQALLRSAVERYGPNGSFWTENAGVPKKPIRFWQIWNEPNFFYFVARPNPAEYGKLVKLSDAALTSVDRGAKVVLAGLFSHPIQARSKRRPPLAYFAADFLAQMYRHTPGIKSKFQGVALHPYTGTFKLLVPYIGGVRKVLEENHDGGKALWITEMGWSSQRPRRGNSFAKGRQGQAKQLKGAFGLLRRMQHRWRIARVYWFSVNDQPGSCNFCGGTGLFSSGFVPKPAWYAYVRFAGGIP